jgi:hypothetical protein
MKAKFAHLPLKAYEVFFYGKEYGRYVGHTAAEARAKLARDLYECYDWRDIWPNLSSKRIEDSAHAARVLERHADQGKHWRDKSENVRLQAEADAFNEKYPVGTPVKVLSCEASTWPDGTTTTRTPAWLSGPGSLLVSLEGYSGGFGMEYIQPLNA